MDFTWKFKDLGLSLICRFRKFRPSPTRASRTMKDNAAPECHSGSPVKGLNDEFFEHVVSLCRYQEQISMQENL